MQDQLYIQHNNSFHKIQKQQWATIERWATCQLTTDIKRLSTQKIWFKFTMDYDDDDGSEDNDDNDDNDDAGY